MARTQSATMLLVVTTWTFSAGGAAGAGGAEVGAAVAGAVVAGEEGAAAVGEAVAGLEAEAAALAGVGVGSADVAGASVVGSPPQAAAISRTRGRTIRPSSLRVCFVMVRLKSPFRKWRSVSIDSITNIEYQLLADGKTLYQ